MRKSLGMVIIRYGSGKEILSIIKQLDLLISQEKQLNLSLYVVNNGPGEYSLSYTPQSSHFSYRVIGDPYNRGFAGGINLGLETAYKRGFDYYIVANTDIVIKQSNFFSHLIYPFEKDSSVGILSPKIYFAPGFEFHKERYSPQEKGRVIWYAGGVVDWNNVYASHRGVDEVDSHQFDKLEETDFATGCLLVLRQQVLTKTKGFDARYFLYFEDVDLSLRTKRAGFKIIYNPRAYIYHKNAQFTHGSGSKLHFYYQERNRLLLGFSYAPLRTKLALVKNVVFPYLFFSSRKRKIVTDAINLLTKKPVYAQITA